MERSARVLESFDEWYVVIRAFFVTSSFENLTEEGGKTAVISWRRGEVEGFYIEA